jgi:hypothetical protein
VLLIFVLKALLQDILSAYHGREGVNGGLEDELTEKLLQGACKMPRLGGDKMLGKHQRHQQSDQLCGEEKVGTACSMCNYTTRIAGGDARIGQFIACARRHPGGLGVLA